MSIFQSFFFRFAVDSTQMTLIPRSTSVNPAAVGSQSVLSQYDIQSLTRAYSCAGRVSTNAGGYSQVIIDIHLTFIHSQIHSAGV